MNAQRMRGLRRFGERALAPIVILIAWQLASMFGLLPERLLAPPLQVAATFWSLVANGEIGSNLLVSLQRVAIGLSFAVLIGGSLALLSGLSRVGEVAIDAPVQMFRTIPFLALVPLIILWFGINETPKVMLVALGGSFPIYFNLYAGIRAVDTKLVEAATCFGLNRLELVWHVVLPGALPSFLVGLRYALGNAWLSLVVAEQINAVSGIGYLITTARDFMRTDIIVVCLVVYALLGLSTDIFIRTIERYALVWRPSFLRDKA